LDALTEEVNEVKTIMPLIAALGVSAMKHRHWAKVFELLKENMPSNL